MDSRGSEMGLAFSSSDDSIGGASDCDHDASAVVEPSVGFDQDLVHRRFVDHHPAEYLVGIGQEVGALLGRRIRPPLVCFEYPHHHSRS